MKEKRNLFFLRVCFILFGLIWICPLVYGEESGDTQEELRHYYLNGDETTLESDRYKPQESDPDYLIMDLVDYLNERTAPVGKVSLLEEGVAIESYKIDQNCLGITFNRKYSQMSRVRSSLLNLGLVKTFLQVPGIESVEIYSDEGGILDVKGNLIGELNQDSFVELNGSTVDTYNYDTFSLYFTDSSGKKLVQEQRSVYYKKSLPKEKVIMEQLAKGPMEKDHYPVLADKTSVINISISDRICYICLNRAFLKKIPEVTEDIPIYAIANSIISAGNADRVQILVEGEEAAVFGETMQLYHFYGWSDSLIKTEEDDNL